MCDGLLKLKSCERVGRAGSIILRMAGGNNNFYFGHHIQTQMPKNKIKILASHLRAPWYLFLLHKYKELFQSYLSLPINSSVLA